MILITTYYKTSNESRNIEIETCLKNNYLNPYIEKIYLLNNFFYDLSFIENNSKIEQFIISRDENYILKYNDAINFINKNCKNKICILSNSDIYFDNSLSLLNNINMYNKFFALLRYDEDSNGNKTIFTRHNEPRDDSQDCWIFKAPLSVSLDKLDFSFRTLGCDSIFAKHIYDIGLQVSNPSLSIISTHLHKTDYRTYNYENRIHGVYCLVKPCFINEYYKPTFMDY